MRVRLNFDLEPRRYISDYHCIIKIFIGQGVGLLFEKILAERVKVRCGIAFSWGGGSFAHLRSRMADISGLLVTPSGGIELSFEL